MIEGSLDSSDHEVQLLISDPLRPIDWLWGITHQLNPVCCFFLPVDKPADHKMGRLCRSERESCH